MSDLDQILSRQARAFRSYQPRYPVALYRYLSSLVSQHELAWDCGSGSGQVAVGLIDYFKNIVATDVIEEQVLTAEPHPQIEYRVEKVESTTLKKKSVDLIVAAQSFHLFQGEEFFDQVQRVLKPSGALAVWCYGLPQIEPEIDALLFRLHDDILAQFQTPQSKALREGYRSIPFPLLFAEEASASFRMSALWSLPQLLGYIGNWPAFDLFLTQNKTNPLNAIYSNLKMLWGTDEDVREVRWEIGLRIGKSPK